MDRRRLIASGLVTLASTGLAGRALAQDEPQDQPPPPPQDGYGGPPPSGRKAPTYSADEMIRATSDFMGVTAEAAGAAIERIFRDNGRPTGYLAGEEGSGALTVGARYGRGLLYMKEQPQQEVFWQGPSIGFDVGGNASRVFTLCYNLQYPDAIFRRFPGVEGTAYLVAGLGVNYQRAEDIVLAPIRAGVGLRLGANLGYLSYSRKRHWLPL
ncbi:hypothetical protein QO010_002256 [Caulobacter ginsengisoli]|uniref:DUF1134 domain-containing protein n=1 Tax=Caulobacter ginsengisoli TaxID=400775 RepID=A0ABU0ISS3_9CAUL|nr:DUF1134 domain-containing protein [Caulobacter ginsengisoli]MDQ0464475.1 hypothetical protein [Caulobacter ginsengisoli]